MEEPLVDRVGRFVGYVRNDDPGEVTFVESGRRGDRMLCDADELPR